MRLPPVYLWHPAPAIRLLLAFVLGILLQWHLQPSSTILSIAAGFALLLNGCFSFTSLAFRFRWNWIRGLCLHTLLIIAGSCLVNLNDPRLKKTWIGHYPAAQAWIVTTLEAPVEKRKSVKLLVQAEGGLINGTFQKRTGRILLYLAKGKKTSSLLPGTLLLLRAELKPVRNSGNPGAFDFRRHSLFQGVTHQATRPDSSYQILTLPSTGHLPYLVHRLQQKVLGILSQHISGTRERALAEALLIGYRNNLDPELLQTYSNTGVIHVIAVSGLHLGLIYALAHWLTRPLARRKGGKWPATLLILGALWLFSLLAGAQPSVLRAAVMFSGLAIGAAAGRKTNAVNTLALSAFLLLCWNPFWLWDLGFQLSYAALLGITWLYKPVYRWFYFPNKLLDNAWKLQALTLAAQVFTLPITLYHFHQVPTLFVLTNMVAVALSSLILMAGIALCALSSWPAGAAFLGTLVQQAIRVMNTYMERLERVSFATLNDLSFSTLQVFLLYLLLISAVTFLFQKRLSFLYSLLGTLTLLLSLRATRLWKTSRQSMLIVYQLSGHRGTDLLAGATCTFFSDPGLVRNRQAQHFYLRPARLSTGVSRVRTNTSGRLCIRFRGRQIVLTTGGPPLLATPVIDVLVLSGKTRTSLSSFPQGYTIRQVVLDGTVPRWKREQWKKDCARQSIPCHDVYDKGAFVMNLPAPTFAQPSSAD